MPTHDFAVLIVDDELSQAEDLADWLRRNEKMEVEIATSGESALDLLRQTPEKYGVMLLDQIFLTVTGIGVLQRIKAEFPSVFVVIVTEDDGKSRLEAFRQGAYRCVPKPVNNSEIGFLIQHIAEIQEMERRLRLERQLGEAAGREAEQLKALLQHELEISRLALSGDYDKLADYITMAVSDLTGTDVSLWMVEQTPSGSSLRIKAGRGLTEEYQQKAAVPLDLTSMITVCLQEKRPVAKSDIFDDTESPTFYYMDQARLQGWRSFLAVPLLDSTGQPLGALSIYSHQRRDFSDMEKNLLVTFANQAAVALENVRLTWQAQSRQKSLEQLVLSGQITTQEVSVERDVLNQFVELACRLTGAPCAAIYPYDPERGEFYDIDRVVAIGLRDEQRTISHKPRKSGLAAIVRHTGFVVLHDLDAGDIGEINYAKVPECMQLNRERLLEIICEQSFMRRENIKAFVGISLRVVEDTDVVQSLAEVGVLFINFRAPHHFSDAELSLIQLFAQQVASLIRAARLRAGLQEQLRTLSDLNSVGTMISTAPDLYAVCGQTIEHAMTLLKADAVVLYRYHRQSDNVIVPPLHQGVYDPNILSRPGVFHENSVPRRLIRLGNSHYADHAKGDATMEGAVRGENEPKTFVDREGIVSSAGVVLRVMDEIIGVLFINYRNPHHFSSTERDKIELFASHAAVAIQNALRLEEVKQRAEALGLLQQVSSRISASLDLDQTLSFIVTGAMQFTGMDSGVVHLIDETGQSVVRSYEFPEGFAHPFPRLSQKHTITRTILDTGKLIAVPDTKRDERVSRVLVEDRKIKSLIGLPLRFKGKVIGVLLLNASERREFPREEQSLLLTLADQAAIAVENARLHQDLSESMQREQVKADQLVHLHQVSETMMRTLDSSEIVPLVVKSVNQLLGPKASSVINLYDAAKGEFVSRYADGSMKNVLEKGSPRKEGGTGITVLREGRPLFVEEAKGHYLTRPESLAEGIRSFACLPLIVGNMLLGTLYTRFEEQHHFSQGEQLVLKLFANQAAVAIQNALRLEEEQHLRQQADTLRDVSRAISATLLLDQAGTAILEGLRRVVEYQKASVQVVNGDIRSQIASVPSDMGTLVARLLRPLSEDPLINSIVASKQPLILSNLSDPAKAPAGWEYLRETEHIKSWAGVPLVYGDRTIGLLTLDHDTPGYYSEAVRDLLISFGNQAAIAIENARLYQQLAQQLSVLRRIDRIVGSIGVEAADPMPLVLEETAKLFVAEYGSFSTVDPNAGSYIPQAIWNNGKMQTGDQIPQDKRNLPWDQGIVGYVAREGRPYRAGDATKDLLYIPWHESVASEMAVPLKGRDDQVIGVLNLESISPNAFDDADQSLCAELASVAAVAIEKYRLFETLQRLNGELEGLHKVVTGQTPQSVMDQALEGICAILGEGTSASICLYSEEQGFSEGGAHGPLDSVFRAPPWPHGTGMHVVETGEPYYLDDAGHPPKDGPALRQDVLDCGVKSFAALPLKWQNRVLGVFFIHLQKPTRFSDETRRTLQLFAGQVAVALENSRLYESLERRIRDLEVLSEIGQTVSNLGIDQILDLVYATMGEVMDLRDAQVQFAFYDSDNDEVTFPLAVEQYDGREIDRVRWGNREPKYRRIGEGEVVEELKPRSRGSRLGLDEYVIHTMKPILIVEDFQETANRLRIGERQVRVWPTFGRLRRPTYSWLGVPMIVQARVIGIISIQSLEQEHAFDQRQVALLSTVASQAAVAIENAGLYAVLTDNNAQLTGKNQQLAEAYEQLMELDRKKSEFLSTVSHELRTPLTPIKQCLQTTLEGIYGHVNDRQRDRLEIALDNVNHESMLVDNLLDLIRIQEGRIMLDLRLEDVVAIIRSVIQILEHDALEKNIQLKVELSGQDQLRAHLDRIKIKQVISNLVHNAIKFTPKGGVVAIQATGDAERIRISVADTGVGIPESEKDRIFERFYQVDSSLTRQEGGTGIGLAIVKEYVERHGGSIRLTSQPNLGSTFTFDLPKRPGDQHHE